MRIKVLSNEWPVKIIPHLSPFSCKIQHFYYVKSELQFNLCVNHMLIWILAIPLNLFLEELIKPRAIPSFCSCAYCVNINRNQNVPSMEI